MHREELVLAAEFNSGWEAQVAHALMKSVGISSDLGEQSLPSRLPIGLMTAGYDQVRFIVDFSRGVCLVLIVGLRLSREREGGIQR